MNHNVYHIEKQTFHFGGYWLLTGTLFFLYLPTSQFEMQNAYHALSKDWSRILPPFSLSGLFSVFSDSAAISVMSFFSSQKTEWFHPVLPDIWHFRSGDRIIIRSKHGSFLKNSECCFWHWSQCFIFPFLDTGCLFPCGSAHFRNWFSPAAFCFCSDSDFCRISVPRSLLPETSSLKIRMGVFMRPIRIDLLFPVSPPHI